MIDRFEGKNRFLSNFYWHDGWCVEIPFQAAKATNEKYICVDREVLSNLVYDTKKCRENQDLFRRL